MPNIDTASYEVRGAVPCGETHGRKRKNKTQKQQKGAAQQHFGC